MTQPPSRLNKDLFTTVLGEKLKTDISIIDLKVEADKRLVNYCSDIHRVTVKYSYTGNEDDNSKVVNLLVKGLHDEFSNSSTEYLMYMKVLPELNEILSKCGVDKPISADAYLIGEQQGELHIFEDLNARGYAPCKPLEGFSKEEAHLVFKRLGQLHAASMIFKAKHPDFAFKSSSNDSMDFLETNFSANIAFVTKIIDSWPAPYPAIAAKMRQNTGDVFKRKFVALFTGEQPKLNVIVHGDLSFSNILVLTSGQQPIDAVFIDYQGSHMNSPAMDIYNLYATSCTLQAVESRQDLVQSYYTALRSILELSADYPNENIPSLELLLAELKRTSYMIFFRLFFNTPLGMLRKELAREMNFASLADAERMARNREDMFSHAGLLSVYVLLPQLDAEGVLD